MTHIVFSVVLPKLNGSFDVKSNSLFWSWRRRRSLTGSRWLEPFVVRERYLERIDFLDLLTHAVDFDLNINSNIKSQNGKIKK